MHLKIQTETKCHKRVREKAQNANDSRMQKNLDCIPDEK